MKKFILLAIVVLPLIYFAGTFAKREEIPFGLRYIHFLNQKTTDAQDANWELLFASSVQKIVNSKKICTDRAQLIQQMINVETSFGVTDVNLLNFIIADEGQTNVVQFEITFKDNTTETVIAILKRDENDHIIEINEVFGTKEAYDWQPPTH